MPLNSFLLGDASLSCPCTVTGSADTGPISSADGVATGVVLLALGVAVAGGA